MFVVAEAEAAAIRAAFERQGAGRIVVPRHQKRAAPSELLAPSAQMHSAGYHAPQVVDCASVSPSVRSVSAIVRRTPASVSANVRRAVYHCAPLHLAGCSLSCSAYAGRQLTCIKGLSVGVGRRPLGVMVSQTSVRESGRSHIRPAASGGRRRAGSPLASAGWSDPLMLTESWQARHS
jgi:hypothetical protein